MGWTELDPMLAAYKADSGPFCLATLVRVTGSSYRQPGARLLVNRSGKITGSLSAGCVEDGVAVRAAEVVRTGCSEMMTFDLRSLYGCDGAVLVALERVVKPHAFFQALQRCREERKPFLAMMRRLDGFAAAGLHTEICSEPVSMDAAGCFTEMVLPPVRLVLVGDRPDLQPLMQLTRFLHWEVEVVEGPESVPPGDPYAGCVIMSHRFGVDAGALKAALEQPYGYLALVGGRQRRERVFHELLETGIEPEGLPRVHGPAGLDIGAETPEEIALAIVAEAQAVFSGRQAGFLKHRRSAIHLSGAKPSACPGLMPSF